VASVQSEPPAEITAVEYGQDGRYQAFQGDRIDHSKGDHAVRLWFILAVLWFAIFTTFGLILAFKFFVPTFIGDVSWFTFGVVRAAHVNGVLFGFVSSGLLGAMFYIMPRLCAAPLYRPRLAFLTAALWNAAVLAGIIWILLGGSQGREYAELPWGIDVLIMIDLILLAYIVLGTVAHRKEKKLFVAAWYYIGTVLWFPVLYFIGNVMWNPPAGALNGMQDAIFNWYYGHNVLGLWFTTLGVPAVYYFISRIIKRPIYSHLLSLIGFFSIAFFYTGVGGHHLLQAPIPEWLKTMAVVMTVLMLVPVLAFAVNVILTMRGSWKKLPGNYPLMFIVAAFFMYNIGSIQGTFQGLRDSNVYLHFSQWTVAHSHITLLGAFGFLAAGLALWIVPRTLKMRLFSFNLMRISWWTAFIGFILFFSAMVITGLVANANWFNHINVVETLPTLRIPFIARAISGGIVVVAAYMVAVNIAATFIKARHPVLNELRKPLAAETSIPHSIFQRKSQESISLPVIIVGGVGGFALMSFMVVAMPYMFSASGPSNSPAAHELTASQEAGQNIYKANGCFYCHNQFIREVDWAMGEESEPGDFYYSVPNLFGTERTGPALGAIGGKRPTEWHKAHDKDPRSVSPTSVMPPFAFLSDQDLNSLVDYIQNLGGEDLDPHAFQTIVPREYRGKENPNNSLAMQVLGDYDLNTETYSGPDNSGQDFAKLFDEGKELFTQKCLSCHGAAGNGQGPYARQTLAHPANLNERISNFPDPQEEYHNWRVHEGVPGTAMPPWGWSLNDTDIWKIVTYETGFVNGATRTVTGDISDAEGDKFNDDTHILPSIAGTQEQFDKGGKLFDMYCAACHGADGKGDGPASIKFPGGYIKPVPANFTESGSDFTNYGRWAWKVKEGVETTNMPPWKEALTDDEREQIIFYIQGFSVADDYNQKWAPLYTDEFAQNLKR
jgi:cytochrome c oxidase cbb3-type subunit I/II